jgi:hypothetical protein
LLEVALAVARSSAGEQRPDGSWLYGESSTQRWIDNFHTGYNLSALRTIGEALGTSEFESCIRRGYEFYLKHFFESDGAPKYFHDRTYPLDIHCAAQSIITLINLKDISAESMNVAEKVLDWTLDHMRDERGFFYYQRRPGFTNKLSFMRWSQAWMLVALATALDEFEPADHCGQSGRQPEAREDSRMVAVR